MSSDGSAAFAEFDLYSAYTNYAMDVPPPKASNEVKSARPPNVFSQVVKMYRNKSIANRYNNGSGYIPSMSALSQVYKAYKSSVSADGTLPDKAVINLFAKKYESASKSKPKAKTKSATLKSVSKYQTHMQQFMKAGWSMEAASFAWNKNKTRKTPIQPSDIAYRNNLERKPHNEIKQVSDPQLKRLSTMYDRLVKSGHMKHVPDTSMRMRSYHQQQFFSPYRVAGWSSKGLNAVVKKIMDGSEPITTMPLPSEFGSRWKEFSPESYDAKTGAPVRRGRMQKQKQRKQTNQVKKRAKKMYAANESSGNVKPEDSVADLFEQDLKTM